MTALEQWKESARVENLPNKLQAQPIQAIVDRIDGAKLHIMLAPFVASYTRDA